MPVEIEAGSDTSTLSTVCHRHYTKNSRDPDRLARSGSYQSVKIRGDVAEHSSPRNMVAHKEFTTDPP